MAKLVLNTSDVLGLVEDRLREAGCLKNGVGNPADPTAYTNGRGWVVLDRCYGPEEPQKFAVSYHASWGTAVEVEWRDWERKKHPRKKVDVYQDSGLNRSRQATDEDLQFLFLLLKEGEWSKKEPTLKDREDAARYREADF